MAIKAAELQVVIGADTNPAVQGIRSTMGKIGNVASTALGVFTGTMMTQAVGALGGLASAGIQAVGEFERMSATLGTLVKRDLQNTGQSLTLVGEKTQELLQWVQQLAKESPFDATGVTTALRTAMAYGFTTEQAQRLAKATIDYAAGSGQSADVMNQVALALGQIQAKGKLAGQEMLQLVNAGIDVRDALSKYLGKSVQEVSGMIEKGMIDSNTAIEAVVSTLEKDFGGAAKEQTQTVSGLISTFQELKQMGLRELFSGLVDAIRPLAASFLEWLQEDGIAKLREIGTQIGNLTVRAIEFVQGAAPTFQAVMAWIRDNGATIQGVLMGIAIAFGAMAVVSTVTALVTALANPLTLVIALAGLLGAAWVNNWGGIQEKTAAVWAWLQPIFESIRTWLSANLPTILAALQVIWGQVWTAISTAISVAWLIIQTIFTSLGAWLSVAIPAYLTVLQQVWSAIWTAVVSIFRVVWPIIQAIWQAFRAAFEGDWYAFGAKLREAWDKAWEGIKAILRNAWSAIKSIVSNLVFDVQNFFTNTDWGSVGDGIVQGIAAGISSGASAIVNAARSAAKAALDAAKGFLGIRSPSRLFEQQVGRNMVLGWARGVERYAPILEVATAGAGMRARDTAQQINNHYYYNLSVQTLRSAEQIAADFALMAAR